MARKVNTLGFSLVELLLVLAIIGILSGIAIPSFMGQRKRVRVIGDAQANAQILRMQLETAKADSGLYGAAGTYNWIAATGPDTGAATLLPAFTTQGSSQMDYGLVIAAGGISYVLSVTDPSKSGALTYKTDQTGAALFVLH